MGAFDEVCREIVERLIEDLTDRRGLRQQWDQCDEDVRGEIRDAWRKIIREGMENG